MAAIQFKGISVSCRKLPSFERFRPSTVKMAASVPLKPGLIESSSFTWVVKYPTVLFPRMSNASKKKSLKRLVLPVAKASEDEESNCPLLKPYADRVLVKIKKLKDETTDGISLLTSTRAKPQVGEVIAIGDGRTIGKKPIEISVKPGTQVVYSKFAGTKMNIEGSIHVVLKEDDIIGILETDDIKDLKPLNDTLLIVVGNAEAGYAFFPDLFNNQPSFGLVVAVGPGPLDEEGNRKALSLSRGNIVMFSSDCAGNDFIAKDGYKYIALTASDVLAIVPWPPSQ